MSTGTQYWLALTALVLGLGLAWSELATTDAGALPDEAAASVAGRLLYRAELARAIDAANNGRRELLSNEQEQQVLNRLIDEVLLLQYGLDLGLVYDNPTVSKPLVQAVLGMVRANAANKPFSEAEQRHWYLNNQALFAGAGQWRVRYYRLNQAGLSAEQLLSNARALRALLQQREPSDAELYQWQAERVTYVPDSLLPVNKLQDYLGQQLVASATELAQPGVTEPVKINHGMAVLQILQAQPAGPKRYEDLQTQVLAAMRREHGERALRELLDDLRGDYEVLIADD